MSNPTGISEGENISYKSAGVDIEAGHEMIRLVQPLLHTTARVGADTKIGGFGSVFDLGKTHFSDPLLVAASDGVGTKVKIAAESRIPDTVGIDLVAMCVNDLIVQGAEPLFFLDYYASGALDPVEGARIIRGIVTGCRQAGCALIGGETAEMPGIYRGNDYDLAGFCVGAVEREALLPRTNLTAGDQLLGLASSGLHANGFALVRKIVGYKGIEWTDPAPFAAGRSFGYSLLEPTKIYVKPLLKTLSTHTGIKALAHITGGGLQDNVSRILTEEVSASVDLSRLTPSPVFGWLAREGKIDQEEMLRTFNCGVGMVVIVEAKQALQISAALTAAGEQVCFLGELTRRTGEQPISFRGTLAL